MYPVTLWQFRDAPAPSGTGDGRYRLLAGLLLGLVLSAGTPDVGLAEGKGRFEVRSAASYLEDGVYFATARVDYELSDAALEALASGLTLTIQLQLEVTRVRRLWPDKEVARLVQDYELSFQPLSERYVVRNANSGEQASFSTLFAALSYLGRVVDLPVIDAALLDESARYRIALRAVLDQNTLPGPLQVLAFWSDGFRLESDWYRWKLSE